MGDDDDTRPRLLLIVTGSVLRAEEADRPLAYYLQQQIRRRLDGMGPRAEALQVHVIADFRWLHEDLLHDVPTISIGGPGVNVLAQRWDDDLTPALVVDDSYVIQRDADPDVLHVSLWGMDNPSTQLAVAAFLQRYLPEFLDRCLNAEPPDLDLDAEDDDDPEDEDEDDDEDGDSDEDSDDDDDPVSDDDPDLGPHHGH